MSTQQTKDDLTGYYLLDGMLTYWRDLIAKASDYDAAFARSGMKFTSEAAEILRANGHTVAEYDPA